MAKLGEGLLTPPSIDRRSLRSDLAVTISAGLETHAEPSCAELGEGLREALRSAVGAKRIGRIA
ncbi:MAG TPA: hypothetical protein VF784_17210, partial [Anaerolineales bacterium]